MKFSAIAIVAFTSLAVAKPIPDGDSNVVPISWNDIEAGAGAGVGVDAAQASASAVAEADSTVNLAARHAPGIPMNYAGSKPNIETAHGYEYGVKGGAEDGNGHHRGSRVWGRDNNHVHEGEHGPMGQDQGHDVQGKDQGKGEGLFEYVVNGHKSGAENGGFHGGSHLWGRDPEAEAKKGKGGVNPDIVGVNPFDEGGDHSNDPSWG